MANRKQYNMKFPPDLIKWVDGYAAQCHTNRTAVVEDLLQALRDGRIRTVPRAGMNPFPHDQVRAGETPEYPALISFPPTEE